MATAKYNPNPINYGIIPKQWLNTPVMSSEEAFMELEKLQNAELANEINQQNADIITRKNQAQQEAIDEYDKAMEIKRQANEPELLSTDDAMALARKYQIKSGDPSGLADDELRRLQIQSLDEERKRRAEEDKYVVASPYSDVLLRGDEGLVNVRPGKEKPKSEGRPRWLINPDTLEAEQYSGDEADQLEQEGWISAGRANAEKLAGDIKFQRDFESRRGKVDLNPAGGKKESGGGKEPAIDYRAPPGAQVVPNADKTELTVTFPDGTIEKVDLITGKVLRKKRK